MRLPKGIPGCPGIDKRSVKSSYFIKIDFPEPGFRFTVILDPV
jgi:hypothetical protein